MTSDIEGMKAIADRAAEVLPGVWRTDTEEDLFGDVAFLYKDASEERWLNFAHCSGDCLQWLAASDYIATFDPPTVLSLLAEIERLRGAMEHAGRVRDFLQAYRTLSSAECRAAFPEWFSGFASATAFGRLDRATDLLVEALASKDTPS